VTGVTVRLGRIAVIGSRVDPYLHPWVESRVSQLRRASRERCREASEEAEGGRIG
jgi:hypothetical protein